MIFSHSITKETSNSRMQNQVKISCIYSRCRVTKLKLVAAFPQVPKPQQIQQRFARLAGIDQASRGPGWPSDWPCQALSRAAQRWSLFCRICVSYSRGKRKRFREASHEAHRRLCSQERLHEVLPVNTRQGTLLRGYWIHELPSCLWDFRHRGPHGTVCQALRRQTKRTTYQRQIVRRQPFTKSRLLRAVGTAATAATSSPATAAFITAESECDRSGVDDETAVKKYFGRSSELCYVKGVRDQFQCILFSGTSEASLKRIYMRQ